MVVAINWKLEILKIMARFSELNSKNININEKLYKDSYFKLLYFREKQKVSNSLEALCELINQSNIHCTEQNMTDLGAVKYKSELFAEYFELMDNKDQEGFLPVINNTGKYKIPCFQPEPSQFVKGSLKQFNYFICNSNGVDMHRTKELEFNSILECSRNDPNLFITAGKEKLKTELVGKAGIFSGCSNKLPRKSKFEELSDNQKYRNKKVCIQSKPEVKQASPGFVSASTLYQNPLKQDSESVTVKSGANSETDQDSELRNNEVFKNFDKKIVDIVLNEIMDFSPNVKWSDIAGLDFVKTTVQEIVIWPLLRPDIFTGLRAPPRGILLFGPPGTGKTLIGKCIATESNSTFFCISASSLASKWVGESEQMVRALFAAARLNQPSVIFIDEIDSLLSQRTDKDQDFTRKLKTEFLVQFDGAKTNSEERVLVVGATNRPHELDEAARRRFVKRLFVPLPDELARQQIIQKLIGVHQHNLSVDDFKKICDETAGYSGSDVAHLCKEAAMGPIRSVGPELIKTVSLDQVRPISLCDFTDALRQVRASVVADDLNYYKEWNDKFGSFGIPM